MRLTRECRLTPIVRLSFGRAAATRLMVAGSDRASQEMNATAPRITACHVGQAMTTT